MEVSLSWQPREAKLEFLWERREAKRRARVGGGRGREKERERTHT